MFQLGIREEHSLKARLKGNMVKQHILYKLCLILKYYTHRMSFLKHSTFQSKTLHVPFSFLSKSRDRRPIRLAESDQ